MSKKRLALVSSLIVLVIATVAFFVISAIKKAEAPIAEQPQKQPIQVEKTQQMENVLQPLPADNKTAIESEINNIDKEINSTIETELDDLSDIEESL